MKRALTLILACLWTLLILEDLYAIWRQLGLHNMGWLILQSLIGALCVFMSVVRWMEFLEY
jgi:hypothetical protein